MKKAPEIKIKFFNTLGRQLQEFKPLDSKKLVRMYNCGPTVYDFAHIGNLRAFVFADTLRRTLEFFGFKVIQVMNITDVGHLTSDDDLGEDKILKGLKREREKQGKELTVYDIIEFYTNRFLEDIKEMNIKKPTYMPRATAHVEDMIRLIQTLIDKGYAYVTKHAVYFDVTKFPEYTKLFPQALDEKIVGARNEVNVDPEKKHPADFRLWQLDQPNHLLQWDSPWGKGFPGWHIECSAMSMKYLGPTLDIHTGGVDHIPVHHTNEIAQSEAATGEPFSRFWMHNEFLTVEGGKMSKSLGNFYSLRDVKDMGYKPMHLRYFYLTAKYRAKLDFSKKALEAAKNSYEKLNTLYQIERSAFVKRLITNRDKKDLRDKLKLEFQKLYLPFTKEDASRFRESEDYKGITYEKAYELAGSEKARRFIVEFAKSMANDLNTPQALSHVWEALKDKDLGVEDKMLVFSVVYHVLGLIYEPIEDTLTSLILNSFKKFQEIMQLIKARDRARELKDYSTSDAIRDKLKAFGYNVIDHIKLGTVIYGSGE